MRPLDQRESLKFVQGPVERGVPLGPHWRSRAFGCKLVLLLLQKEREAVGIPDPVAKFTNPVERDFIRARYKWDKEKKVFYTDQIMRKLIRLLVIILLPPYI